MNKFEAQLEATLTGTAPMFKCMYIKIPDAIKTPQTLIKANSGKYTMRELQRPYDGNLVSTSGVYCIEAKANYNNLEPHQKRNQDRILDITKNFYVIRIILKEKSVRSLYRIEQPEKNVLLETNHIEDIFKFFNELKIS